MRVPLQGTRMVQQHFFGQALRRVRMARGMTQEDFSIASGRTYISQLERGERGATLAKIAELAEAMGVHPLTLVALAFASSQEKLRKLLAEVGNEAESIMRETPPKK